MLKGKINTACILKKYKGKLFDLVVKYFSHPDVMLENERTLQASLWDWKNHAGLFAT